MKYLILHYFFMVCICNKRTFTSAFSKRANNYDIDEFINQLLTSQKFDELAEKVADIAVNKIKNMDSFPFEHRNMNENQHRYQEKKRDFDTQSLVYKQREQRAINDEILKPGKINTQVLMKKEEDDGHSDSLTLKYKYLKKHALDKKSHDQHSALNEHNPIWRNIELPAVKHSHDKPKKVSSEDRDHETKHAQHFTHAISVEKVDDFDKNINFDKNIDFYGHYNVHKNTKNNENAVHEKTTSNYDKNINFDNINNYEKHEEHNKYDRNDNQVYKPVIFNENVDEHGKDSRNNDRGREESNERYKPEFVESKPQFKSGNTIEIPPQVQAKENLDDSPPTIIDLDDNNDSHAIKIPTVEDPKNVYRDIVEQQKNVKKEYRDEDIENLDEHKMQDDDGWREEGKLFGEEINSENDSGYKKPTDVDEKVTSGFEHEEITTRKRNLRREGDKVFTYQSAPEYAEYHESLAKQKETPKDTFDMVQ